MGSINPQQQPTPDDDQLDGNNTLNQAYWQINAPPTHPARTSPICPPFLLKNKLPPKDLVTISTPNHLYQRDTWSQVRRRVQENKLAEFQRRPADMWRYLEFSWKIKEQYREGGVKEFILKERLKWGWPGEVVAKGTRFGKGGCEEDGTDGDEDEDVKILWNDWPYGIDERIVHLVVWTKFELVDDPATGDLTDEARAEIDDYVRRTFGRRVPEEHIIWFKNWAHIKSVKAVEHFHVMLFDPDPEFVKEITKGDVPLGIIQTN